MAVILAPDPKLEKVCTAVDGRNRGRLDVAANLLIALGDDDGALGVAAPQVGSTLRMFAYRRPRTHELDVAVNPRVVSSSGKQLGREGCLSYPDRWWLVERPQTVVFTADTLEGDQVRHRWQGIYARLVCHEIDHLDGRLIADYGKELR